MLTHYPTILAMVIALLLPFNIVPAAEYAQPSLNFWTGEPIVSTCTKIPQEPLDDADHSSTDYAVGLLFLEYDLDGDGRYDFMTARQIEKISHHTLSDDLLVYQDTNPLFYWVDLDADSTYDQLWIDRGGQGRCDDIVLYEGASPRIASNEWTQNVMMVPSY